jgi:starch synthase
MKILMVSSEATPFAKSGGLGDAVSALSAALARLGHDVRLVIPRYYFIDRKTLESLGKPLDVPDGAGGDETRCAVFRSYLPGSTVETYFLDCEKHFGRDGIYGSKAEPDYADNPDRFGFLSRAAFALCGWLGWTPDVFHAHDWPSSVVPALLARERKAGRLPMSASVLSIHNLGYQGVYPKESFSALGLPWEDFHGAGFEFYGKVNMLQAGLRCADCLTTVSPTYAREIQTPDFGFGLDGLLRHRSSDLVGILNGVDLDEWNPETDLRIAARYSAEKMTGKAECKAALQREFGLAVSPDTPLIGMVGRLTDQKGSGELFGPQYGSAFRICVDIDVQLAVVGTGDKWCEDELRSLSSKLANLKAKIGFDERLAHMVEAGSDFFLMPSRYEPCGLNQMYSLRYGTLPIVHRTGGLADTVENYNQDAGTGTGFMFDDLTPRAIYDTVGWAVWAWYNRREHIEQMRRRAMERRFAWEQSAREHEKLYRRALERAPVEGS